MSEKENEMSDEKRAARAALREAARYMTRTSLFEGTGETGELVQLNLAQVVASIVTTRYLQVNLTSVSVRLVPDDAERFREAFRAWLA